MLLAILLRKPANEANDEADDVTRLPVIVTPDWETSVADIAHWYRGVILPRVPQSRLQDRLLCCIRPC